MPWDCPACGMEIDQRVMEKAISSATAAEIVFFECSGCGTLFAPHAMEAARALYAKRDSSNFSPNKNPLLRAIKRQVLRNSYSRFVRAGRATRIVDFGCGNGDLANAFLGLAPDIVAIDVPADRPASLDRAIPYQPVSDLSLAPSSGRTIFILRHVLEHFENPRQQLAELAASARSGDLIIVETPDATSTFRKIMGAGWPGYFPPFHVTVPTLRGLEAIGQAAGLEIKAVRRREPPIMGTYLTQKFTRGANLMRLIGLAGYPLQWLVSRISGGSEAVEVQFDKP